MIKATFGIIDVETTGLDPYKDEIISFGMLVCRYESDRKGPYIKEIGRYEGKQDPGFPIPREATKIHKIKDRHVKGKILDNFAIRQLLRQCEFLVSHNASFDYSFVKKTFPEVSSMNWTCSMRDIDWHKYGHKTRTLEYLARYHNTQIKPNHSVLSDAASVACLLMVRYDGIPLIDELIDFHHQY